MPHEVKVFRTINSQYYEEFLWHFFCGKGYMQQCILGKIVKSKKSDGKDIYIYNIRDFDSYYNLSMFKTYFYNALLPPDSAWQSQTYYQNLF